MTFLEEDSRALRSIARSMEALADREGLPAFAAVPMLPGLQLHMERVEDDTVRLRLAVPPALIEAAKEGGVLHLQVGEAQIALQFEFRFVALNHAVFEATRVLPASDPYPPPRGVWSLLSTPPRQDPARPS